MLLTFPLTDGTINFNCQDRIYITILLIVIIIIIIHSDIIYSPLLVYRINYVTINGCIT